MGLTDFITESNLAESVDEIKQAIVEYAPDLGIKYMAYGDVSAYVASGDPSALGVIVDYPKSWIDYYVTMKFGSHDPVNRLACFARGAFTWEQVRTQKLKRPERMVLEESRCAGMLRGVTVPLHGPMGQISVFSAVVEDDNPLLVKQINSFARQLDMVWQGLDLNNDPAQLVPISLSPREREVLTWVAAGKSNSVIGDILHLSEKTVEFHLQNAMRKLDSSSRVLAALKAVRMCLINPATVAL